MTFTNILTDQDFEQNLRILLVNLSNRKISLKKSIFSDYTSEADT